MALFPCRPDQLTRLIPLAGAMVDLHLTACDAGGASFAVSHAEFADGSAAQAGLAQWRKATLANLSDAAVSELPMDFQLPGAAPGNTQFALTKATGKRGDESAVNFNGIWLLREKRVIHAAIYAPTITAEMSETFFQGLKFQ